MPPGELLFLVLTEAVMLVYLRQGDWMSLINDELITCTLHEVLLG
jgi:hypothetical protein